MQQSSFTPLTYHWTQISGPTVSLSDSTSATPSFTAPLVNSNTDITFQIVVTNSKDVQSNPSFVTITVEPQTNNGNGVSSTGGHGGSGGNAITHSGNANGGAGGNGGSEIGKQNAGDSNNREGTGGNRGFGRHSDSASSTAGSRRHRGSAGSNSSNIPMFSMMQ